MKKQKLIIFDMDGVVVDSIPVAYELILDTIPEMTKSDFLDLFKENYHDAIKKYKEAHEIVITYASEEAKEARKIYYAQKKLESPVFVGVHELLQGLHEDGYQLALNTSAYTNNCIPLLEKGGIRDYFDMIATAEASKSKEEKFQIMMDHFGVSKEDCIFVTDTLGDVREAQKLDIPTIAVTWGAHDRTVFEEGNCSNLVAIVDSPLEIMMVLLVEKS